MNAAELGFVVIVGVIVAFYLIILRPQQQDQKKQQKDDAAREMAKSCRCDCPKCRQTFSRETKHQC